MTAKSIDWDHLSRQGHYCAQKWRASSIPTTAPAKPSIAPSSAAQPALSAAAEPGVRAVSGRTAKGPACPLSRAARQADAALSLCRLHRDRAGRDAGKPLSADAGPLPGSDRPALSGDGIELYCYPESGCRIVLRHDGTFRREAELALPSSTRRASGSIVAPSRWLVPPTGWQW